MGHLYWKWLRKIIYIYTYIPRKICTIMRILKCIFIINLCDMCIHECTVNISSVKLKLEITSRVSKTSWASIPWWWWCTPVYKCVLLSSTGMYSSSFGTHLCLRIDIPKRKKEKNNNKKGENVVIIWLFVYSLLFFGKLFNANIQGHNLGPPTWCRGSSRFHIFDRTLHPCNYERLYQG